MNEKKLDAFKKRLEDRQRDLRQAINRTAQDGRDADLEWAQDIGDRAANSYNKEFLFHQSNNEGQLLQMVEGALDGIRDGFLGQCTSCGNEINPKRLEAVPWARHCIACQEKLEKGRDAIGLPRQNIPIARSRNFRKVGLSCVLKLNVILKYSFIKYALMAVKGNRRACIRICRGRSGRSAFAPFVSLWG
jgi:DnaK suppressor protein